MASSQLFLLPALSSLGTPLTKQEAAYRQLKEKIMQVELPPGHRLIIDDLARELGLSAIPIREAFRQLQADGLVELRPHTGAMVAAITPESVAETFTILEGMEAMAVRRVCAERDEALLPHLKQILGWMDRAISQRNMADWSGLNLDFHLALATATGMPWLRAITRTALQNWDRMRRYFFPEGVPQRAREAQKEHYALVAALEKNEPDAAEKIVREHNRQALAHYLKLVGKL